MLMLKMVLMMVWWMKALKKSMLMKSRKTKRLSLVRRADEQEHSRKASD